MNLMLTFEAVVFSIVRLSAQVNRIQNQGDVADGARRESAIVRRVSLCRVAVHNVVAAVLRSRDALGHNIRIVLKTRLLKSRLAYTLSHFLFQKS
jgi:hypothetical protein